MLLKDDLKKRSWLMVVSVLFFCLFFPGIVLDNVQGMISIYGEQGVESRFLNALTYSGNNYYAMAVFLLAAFCAFNGFSYIYSRQKLDFYHSLPVKRESWLVLKTVSSFLIFALPAGMAVLEELFMGVFYHVTDLHFVEAVLGKFFLYLLVFLSSYFLCLLAMLMTGKLSTGILLTPVLFGFTGVVSWLYRLFQKTFYTGYLESESNNLFRKYPSPGTCMLDLTERWNRYVENGLSGKMSWREPILLILFLLLEIMLCVCLYRNRRTETAGNAVVFPKLGILIKLLAVCAASLGVGICLKTFSYTQSDLWFFGGIALGILVFTGVLDFIFYTDIRNVLKKPLELLAVTALTFGIALVFRFDLLGYDSYLPDADKIASMSVNNNLLSNVYHQVMTYTELSSTSTTTEDSTQTLDAYQLTEFEPIYAMAENGSENATLEESADGDRILVDIRYNLKNGRVVYRTYPVDSQVFEENADELYEKPGFIKAMYPIFGRRSSEISSIWAYGVNARSGSYTFRSKEEKEEFAEAYKQDLLTLSYSDLSGSDLLGNMTISYEPEQQETGNEILPTSLISDEDNGYPILRRFKKTIAVLEKFGVTFPETLDPDEVRELSVWYENSDVAVNLLAVGAGETDLISDSQKKELLDMLSYQYCIAPESDKDIYCITAYGEENNYLQTFIVPGSDLPEDIRTILENSVRQVSSEKSQITG